MAQAKKILPKPTSRKSINKRNKMIQKNQEIVNRLFNELE